MKTRSICPSCKGVLEFDRAKLSEVVCPKCKYKGKAADFEEIGKTEVPDKNKLYKPGKLEFVKSDAQWLHKEKTVHLQRGVNTLGRQSSTSASSLQLPVADSYMSRNHATVEVIMKADAIFDHRLSDNGSANGTFHNGDRLEKGDIIKLTPGDTLRLGHTTFKFITE